MVERIVRQLVQPNQNLKGNFLKTILTENKFKNKYVCMKSNVL